MKSIVSKLKSPQEGFVILFTILISAIILMIGFGIFSIATRETILSGTAREAQFAFYAADAGVECALYLHTKSTALTAQVGFAGTQTVPPCGSATNLNGSGTQGIYGDPFQFDIMVDSAEKTCAHVTVYDPDSSSRRIISQGYNICSTDAQGVPRPVTTNPLLVERVLDTTFQTAVAAQNQTATPNTSPAPGN